MVTTGVCSNARIKKARSIGVPEGSGRLLHARRVGAQGGVKRLGKVVGVSTPGERLVGMASPKGFAPYIDGVSVAASGIALMAELPQTRLGS